MDTKTSIKTSKVNIEYQKGESYQRHKTQRFWQILFPVGVGVLLILSLALMVVFPNVWPGVGVSASQFADASMIWLIIPWMLFAIIIALVLFFIIYLVAKALKILPGYTFLVQHYVTLASAHIKDFSNKAATPFIAVQSLGAGAKAFFSTIFGRSPK